MSTFEARFVSPALCTRPGIISRSAQFGRQRGRNLRFALCHRCRGPPYAFSRKRLFTEFFGGETNRKRLPWRGNFFPPHSNSVFRAAFPLLQWRNDYPTLPPFKEVPPRSRASSVLSIPVSLLYHVSVST